MERPAPERFTTQEPVALWAFPDAMPVKQTAHLGVVAYHRDGISNVVFSVNGIPAVTVANETYNPGTGEMEFVLALDTTGYTEDTSVTIDAMVHTTNPSVPSNILAPRKVWINNVPTTDIIYVDQALGSDSTGTGSSNAPYATIWIAVYNSVGGAEIRVRDGEYHLLANTTRGFNRFVHIHPDKGASPKITSSGRFACSYLHLEGFEFDWTGVMRGPPDNQITNGTAIIEAWSSTVNHLWVENCEFYSVPDMYNNYLTAIRVLNASGDITVEDCRIYNVDLAIASPPSGAIYRGNEIGPITRDAFDFFSDVLITGNIVHDVMAPPLYMLTTNAEPFSFPAFSDLAFHYRELNGGDFVTFVFPDISLGLADPAAATAQEVADAFMDNPGFAAKIVATAENGYVRVRPKRTNHKQELYVTGNANGVLGFPYDSYENRAWGSGQHCDIFQTWGSAQSDIVIRNNRAYGGAFQGLLPQSNIDNLVLVNNLFDDEIDTSWMLYFEVHRFFYQNVLLANNTFWGAWRTMWSPVTSCTNSAIINNIFGPRGGLGDLNHAGLTMDYNLYDYFSPASGEGPAAHSLWTNPCKYTPTQTPLFSNVTTYWKEKAWMFNLTQFDPGTPGYWQYIAPLGDFSIVSNSPARDAGTASAGITYDINWYPRDATPDIGAFEYPVDSDGDTIPDGWEIHYFGDLASADSNSDTDLDGSIDKAEEIAGTNPTNNLSLFEITHHGLQGSSNVVVRWSSVDRRFYSVEASSNLVDGVWSNVESNLPATPPENTCTVNTYNAETYFNRVRVWKP